MKLLVIPSADPVSRQWALIEESKETRWFISKDFAIKAAEDRRREIGIKGLVIEVAREPRANPLRDGPPVKVAAAFPNGRWSKGGAR